MDVKAQQSLSLTVSGEGTVAGLEIEVLLGRIYLTPIVIPVRPVIVVIIPRIDLKLAAEGTISVSMSGSLQQTASASAGVQYDDGFSTYKDADFDVLGWNFKETLSAGIDAVMGFKGKIWKFELADWDTKISIYAAILHEVTRGDCGDGDVQVSLLWSGDSDTDLHVMNPAARRSPSTRRPRPPVAPSTSTNFVSTGFNFSVSGLKSAAPTRSTASTPVERAQRSSMPPKR